MTKSKSLIDWHNEHNLERVILEGGKDYFVIAENEDIAGHLDAIKMHANVEGWGVLEGEGGLLIPTYAYDRLIAANIPGAMPVGTLRCLRCGHAWHPRSFEAPERCPGCNSPYWSKPRTKGVKG